MTKTSSVFGRWNVFLLMVAFLGGVNLPAMDFSGFEKTLTELQRESVANPNSAAVRDLLRKLDANYNPSRWINEVPSPDMASPSSERLERINQIAQVIAPYESVLVNLGFSRTLGSDADRAIDFLWYAAPSPLLKLSLLSDVDKNPIAYQVLFETGMFDNQVRSKFVEGLSATASPELRYQRASMAANWGLVEALPVYLEMLQKPFDPNTISFVGHIPAEDANGTLSDYGLAAQASYYLGSKAGVLKPLLQARYAEIESAFPGKNLGIGLKAAIDSIDGKRPLAIRTAINGRGEINLTKGYSPIAHHTVATRIALTTAPAVNASTPSPIASAPKPSPVAQVEASKSPPWPWIIGAILVLAIAGGILLKLRRK